MGYRSNIMITMKKEFFENNKDKIEAIFDAEWDISFDDKLEVYFFKGEDFKWYDEYKDVKAVNKFLEENPEDTGFLRIGEDMDDTEFRNNYCEVGGLGITRDFYFDGNPKGISREEAFKPNSLDYFSNKRNKKKE